MKNQFCLLSATISILLLVASSESQLWGQAAGSPALGTTKPPGTNVESARDADPGNIDKLLDMADKDVGQLSQVKVAGQTGSPALDMPVSTVARQESTVGRSAAAVFVITNEMIRRSGVTTIPDALRMAPGLEVAQITSNTWAITARGFNSRFANKLLVQIDGRSVYDNLNGGVFWDVQDVLLEDVERIEVIRGPGGTIWGANAMNGVINILTKRSQDTQGVFLQTAAGNHDLGITNGRVGGRINEDTTYRVYGKWFDRNHDFLPDGTPNDAWNQGRGGFRMDSNVTHEDVMTLQGDCYNGYDGNSMLSPSPVPPFIQQIDNQVHVSGANILYRWKRTLDDDADWTFQTYYDRTERHYLDFGLGLDRDILDTQFQNRFPLGSRNAAIWGCEYRYSQDATHSVPFAFNFDPINKFDYVYSYFLQDQITLVEDRLYFTAGSKIEHNNYSNFEYEPSMRLLWTPDNRHSLWGAVSRAVQTPGRVTDSLQMHLLPVSTNPLPVFPLLIPSPGLMSDDLLAYECGMRVQATERFSWDLALFYNQYTNLAAMMSGAPQFEPPGFIFVPTQYVNAQNAETYGIELGTNYQVNEQWRLQGAYTYLSMFLHGPPDLIPTFVPDDNPVNQFYLQSSWDFRRDWTFDLIGRYVDSLNSTIFVPSYIAFDTRVAWHPRKNLEVSVVGRNLCRGTYYEFTSDPGTGLIPTKVGPQVYGQLAWRF